MAIQVQEPQPSFFGGLKWILGRLLLGIGGGFIVAAILYNFVWESNLLAMPVFLGIIGYSIYTIVWRWKAAGEQLESEK